VLEALTLVCSYAARSDANRVLVRLAEAGLHAETRQCPDSDGVDVLVPREALDAAQALLGTSADAVPAEDDLSAALRAPLPDLESLTPDPLAAHAVRALTPPTRPQVDASPPHTSTPPVAAETWTAVCGVANARLAEFLCEALSARGIDAARHADDTGNHLLRVREDEVERARQAIEDASETWFFEETHSVESLAEDEWMAVCGVTDEALATCYLAMLEAQNIEAEIDAESEEGWLVYVRATALSAAREVIEQAGEIWFFTEDDPDEDAPDAWTALCGVARRGLAEFYCGALAETGIESEMDEVEEGGFLLSVRAEALERARTAIEEAGETWIFGEEDGKDDPTGRESGWYARRNASLHTEEVVDAEARVQGRRALLEGIAPERTPRTGLPPLEEARRVAASACPYCGSERVTGSGVEHGNKRTLVALVLVIVVLIAAFCIVRGITPWPFFLLAALALAAYHHVKNSSDYSHFCRDCKRFW
jgi:hypothetical protein